MASCVLKFFFLLFSPHEYISKCFYQAHFGPLLLLRHPEPVAGLFISWWQVRPSVSAWIMTGCVAMQVINHTIISKPHPKSQAPGPWAAVSHIHHTGRGHHSVCHSRDCLSGLPIAFRQLFLNFDLSLISGFCLSCCSCGTKLVELLECTERHWIQIGF